MEILRHTPYLRVADMQRSLAFYGDALGFEVKEEAKDGDGLFWAFLAKDGMSVMISRWPAFIFEHDPETEANDHDEQGNHIFSGAMAVESSDLNRVTYIYVADLDAAYAELVERGVEVAAPPMQRFPDLREFMIKDPDGYHHAIAQTLEAT